MQLPTESEIRSRWSQDLPVVSVCSLIYNHEPYLAEFFSGILQQQTDFAFELICHDDASTDRSRDIILEFHAQYPGIIRYVFQRENQWSQGYRVELEHLYPHARGTYISLCEGDDYWIDPRKLSKQVAAMDAHPNCSICYHASYETSPRGRVPTPDKDQIVTAVDVILGDGGMMPTASIMFRRSVLDETPEYLRRAPVGDYPLQVHCATRGEALYLSAIMSVYRLYRPDSWTNQIDSTSGSIAFRKRMVSCLQMMADELDSDLIPAVRQVSVNHRYMLAISYAHAGDFEMFYQTIVQIPYSEKPTLRQQRLVASFPAQRLPLRLAYLVVRVLKRILSLRKRHTYRPIR